jgi:peptidoglycan-associated lipoprotein
MKASQTVCGRFTAPFLIALACLGGCGTAPVTRTSVVLLPDEESKVGAVSMSTAMGTQLLDKAFSYTTVDGTRAAPSEARAVSRGLINTVYGDLLKEQPSTPRTFTLYFLLDKTVLTEESKAVLPALFDAVRERKPTRITVFGHADASGSREQNLKLSAQRAEAAANMIRTNDPTLDDIEVQFFGETQPLMPSGPGALVPRNRRVEILIL